jgi:ferredoxin
VRRASLFLVAVNCTHPSDTCFCASTGDGPAAQSSFDLLLDELDDGFVIRAGSKAGQKILKTIPVDTVTTEQQEEISNQNRRATECQTRRLPSDNLEQVLFDNLDHPRWKMVAERCLSCGNCTSVCPTCFCYSEQDAGALDLTQSEHIREWDSCFTQGHSYIHGLTIRADTRLRYRQWLTHKLGSWHSQYGRSGCVGCGRCISWCPVGIDITEEVAAVAGND